MPTSSTILIPKCLDRNVIEGMEQICKDLGVGQLHLQLVGIQNQVDLPLDQPDHYLRRTLIDENAEIIQRAWFSYGQFTATYARGTTDDEKQKKFFVDAILFGYNDHPADQAKQKERLELCAKITKRFGGHHLRLSENDPNYDGKQVPDFVAAQASTLARLESLSGALVEKSVERREKLEHEFVEQRARLEAQLKEQRAADAEALSIEREKLAVDREVLKARNQEIDARNNTIVRRQIRNQLLDEVKSRVERFGVSEQTEAKRKPVYWGLMSIIAALFAVVVLTIYEITDERHGPSADARATSSSVASATQSATPASAPAGPPAATTASKTPPSLAQDRSALYWLWARLSVATLSMFGFGFYYVRWQASWAEQHAAAELELRQFQIDINRANWVLESCLEWHKETSSNVPPDLLSSLSKGLFSTQGKEPARTLHPADELASALLGTASKLKLKAGESEIEFNKPGKIPSALQPKTDPA